MSDKNIFGEEVEEEYDVFEKALKKKKHFEGKKGHLLMELQTTYKNDSRFVLDKKFKNDIDARKVPSEVKKMTNAFDRKTETKKEQIISTAEDITKEKNKNLSILSQVISNTDFLGTVQPKKYSNPKNFLIKRFDPKLNIGKELIIKPEEKNLNTEKNVIKLKKGMDSMKDENLLPVEKIKNYKKDKERQIQKEMNELHMAIEPKVEINYSSWKNIISGVEKKENINVTENANFITFDNNKNFIFSPFDGYVECENKEKNETIKPPSKVKEPKENSIIEIKKPYSLFDDSDKKTNEEDEELLLQRKRRKEQRKLVEKQKKEELKLQEKQKDEEIERVLKEEFLKEYDQEKVNNYMRYVNLVREKKNVSSKNKNKE